MDRSDRRPGDEASLLALYDAVPAAEELDLVEEADHDKRQRRLQRFHAQLRGQEAAASAPEPDHDVPTDGQAIGILEHLLGARLIEE
jgi:hypothetical protein